MRLAGVLLSAVLLCPSVISAQSLATITDVRVAATRDGYDVTVAVTGTAGVPTVIGSGAKVVYAIIDNARIAAGRPLGSRIPGIAVTAATNSPTSVAVAITLASAVDASAVYAPGAITINLRRRQGAGAETHAPAAVATPAPAYRELGAKITVIRLNYADVAEIAGILVPGSTVTSNDVFSPIASPFSTAANFSSPSGTLPPQEYNAALGQQSASLVGERLSETLAIDRRLNALVILGDDRVVQYYQSAVAALDVPLASVTLEVEIVELTDSAARDVGIDFSSAGSLASATLQSRTLQTTQSLLTLQAQIFAAVAKGNGRVVARPHILALDGRTASILTGDQLPIITNISYPTSGSSVIQQQIQYLTVGVNVQIRPRIANDGTITTHVYANVSSVTGFVQNYPQIAQRFASTVASVKTGESLVIGGLLQDREINSFTKVPFLGDLPLIGKLFQVAHQTSSKTNLYIMVTPRVLHAISSH